VIWLLSQTLGFPLSAHGSAAAFKSDAYNAVNHPQHEADGRYEFNYLNGSDAYQAGHQFGYVAAGIGLQVGVVAATEGLGELAPVEEGMAEESTVRMGGTMKLVDAAGEEEVAVAEGVRGGESEAKTALTGNSFNEAGQGEFGFAKDLESKPAGEAIKPPVESVSPFARESVQNGASQAKQLELNLSGTGSDGAAEETAVSESKLWSTSEFNGTKVYQRNDLIDTTLVDARGRSNLERMQSGLAPIGPDGQSINLHHLIQTDDSPLAEMTATFHQENSSIIHINPSTIPSGIDRSAFDDFRRAYWINRAKGFSP